MEKDLILCFSFSRFHEQVCPLSLSLCLPLSVSPSLSLSLSPSLCLSIPLCLSVSVCLSVSLFLWSPSYSVCTHIIHLTKKRLTTYTGNYDSFVQTKGDLEEEQMKVHSSLSPPPPPPTPLSHPLSHSLFLNRDTNGSKMRSRR
jgi:hypothetical protein